MSEHGASTAVPAPTWSSRTRVAVVGAGRVSGAHLAVLSTLPEVEVVAVCDPALDRARALARGADVEHALSSVAELAGLEVQIAHVLVPPHLHEPVARELLEAGIGVFVEKPLALSTAGARALGALATERGLPLGVNHNAIVEPAYRQLLRRVRAGEVGRVEHVQLTLGTPLAELGAGQLSSWMFRSPRNIMFEVGPHPFAHILELAGAVRSADTTVLHTLEARPGQVIVDRCVVAAHGERATVELYLALDPPYPGRTIRVFGSDGTLDARLDEDVVTGEQPTGRRELFHRFAVGWSMGGQLRRGSVGVLARDLVPVLRGTGGDAFLDSMRVSITAFHRAVRAGAAPPVGAESGALVVGWCEAAAAGLPTGEVAFPEVPAAGPPRAGEVVVLGANGFIGMATVQALLARRLPVTAVVRRTTGLPLALTDAAAVGRVRILVGSLEDHPSLDRAVEGARTVIHLATGEFDSTEDIERSIVGGTRALLDACTAHGVERLVYVSSISALYLGRDSGMEVIDDDVPPDPEPEERNLYVRGKIAAEAAALQGAQGGSVEVVIARPGIVLGRGAALQHAGLGEWVRGSDCLGWGAGDHPIPVVLVTDVADALALITTHQGAELNGRALNLAARVNLSAADIVTAMNHRTGRSLRFHPRSYAWMHRGQLARWVLKTAVRRSISPVPSTRDEMSMEHYPAVSSNLARDVLGWSPVEERGEFLELLLPPAAAAEVREPPAPAVAQRPNA